MDNVQFRIDRTKLIIEVDLSAKAIQQAKPSSTGATKLVASSRGKYPLPDLNGKSLSFALNVMMGT